MLKRSLFIFIVLGAAIMQTNVALAELKIGVYDNRQILDNLPAVQKEFKKLNAEFDPKKKEISDKQNKLLALKEEIEKNMPLLSATDIQAKQLEYQSKRRELQLLAEDTERVFNVRRNEVARTLQATVEEEVQKVAKEQNFDLVLRSGVLYASPKLDITPTILKRLSEK